MNPVYPGHAAMIILQIIQHYPSFEEAAKLVPENRQYPAALGDSRINGAGGAVYAALDLLSGAAERPIEATFALAQDAWVRARLGGDHPAKLVEGLEQAEAHRDEFRQAMSAWCRGGKNPLRDL